jgi:hypothetical protein
MAALRMGWKYPTYAAHESGWRAFPPKVAQKYARAFDVHPDFLLFGTRPPDWYHSPPQLAEVSVPVRYMAMFDVQSADDIEKALAVGADRRDYCMADLGDLPASCYAFRVQTDEMQGVGENPIMVGDILIMARDESRPTPGSIVLLSVRRQTAPSVRRVKSAPGGRLKFVALNQDYDLLEDSDGKVIGRAVLHVHSL